MNGAQSLFKALTDAGLDTCFANPGTSEMQLVYEMGKTDAVRPVLCLQENVVTGAADGYARMAEKPAFTLLHVGSGFANGIANLHNAGRANIPIVNIVGANASYHQPNFPEHEMIGGKISDLAGVVSHWVREARSASDMGTLGVEAVRNATTGCGRISTMIAPTNCHWDPAPAPPEAVSSKPPELMVPAESIEKAATLLRNGHRTGLLLGAGALYGKNLELAGKIATCTGASLLAETFPPRMERGEGSVTIDIVPYFLEMAAAFFAEYEQIILVAALPPVSTFAYQNAPTNKLPESCYHWQLASPDHNLEAALEQLAGAVGALDAEPQRQSRVVPPSPSGTLTAGTIGQTIAISLPEGSIMVDESATAGLELSAHSVGSRRHDYLYAVQGGAIGGGLPLALGAAIACPDRKVVCLQADGSGMYTNQTLWSIAHEKCDVTTIIIKNDAYAVLNVELARVREGEPTPGMLSMLELDEPSIDWVKMSESMGIPAIAASSAEAFQEAFERAMEHKGPMLIEATISQDLQPVVDLIRQMRPEAG